MAARVGKECLLEMVKEREVGKFAFFEPQIVVGWKRE